MTSSRPAEPSADELAAFVEALGHGRSQARTAEQLADALGLPGGSENRKRRVRLLAEYASKSHLVAADNDGYYRVACADEVEQTIGRLTSQAHRMLERARTLRALADVEFVGQGRLF